MDLSGERVYYGDLQHIDKATREIKIIGDDDRAEEDLADGLREPEHGQQGREHREDQRPHDRPGVPAASAHDRRPADDRGRDDLRIKFGARSRPEIDERLGGMTFRPGAFSNYRIRKIYFTVRQIVFRRPRKLGADLETPYWRFLNSTGISWMA